MYKLTDYPLSDIGCVTLTISATCQGYRYYGLAIDRRLVGLEQWLAQDRVNLPHPCPGVPLK